MGICIGTQSDFEYKYGIGIELKKDKEINNEKEIIEIPKSTWVVFKCEGQDEKDINELWIRYLRKESDFEKFINNEEIDTPDLIKIAILHYQFESIHPFLDGNGRIGRLLIPLYIQSKGMLEKSCLYISDYIERNKDTYYDMLTRARTHNDMIGWIKFFLEAVIETAKTAKEKFRKVVELTMEMDKIIINLPVKAENAKKVIDALYNEPIINRKKLIEITNMKSSTLKDTVNVLLENNIIVETTGYSRNQVFAFQKYIDLFLK